MKCYCQLFFLILSFSFFSSIRYPPRFHQRKKKDTRAEDFLELFLSREVDSLAAIKTI